MSSEVRTFSIQDSYTEALDGPLELPKKITDELESQIIRMRSLTQKEQDGDIQYQIIVKSFTYTPTFSTKGDANDQSQEVEKLTIVVEVSYTNLFDEEASFTQKQFSASRDLVSTEDKAAKEPGLVDDIIHQIVDEICSQSIDVW